MNWLRWALINGLIAACIILVVAGLIQAGIAIERGRHWGAREADNAQWLKLVYSSYEAGWRCGAAGHGWDYCRRSRSGALHLPGDLGLEGQR